MDSRMSNIHILLSNTHQLIPNYKSLGCILLGACFVYLIITCGREEELRPKEPVFLAANEVLRIWYNLDHAQEALGVLKIQSELHSDPIDKRFNPESGAWFKNDLCCTRISPASSLAWLEKRGHHKSGYAGHEYLDSLCWYLKRKLQVSLRKSVT